MCRYQTLFHDDNTGYIIHCPRCNSIQVAFGNVLLTLHREDFSGFRKCIDCICDDYQEYLHTMRKCITVPTPCEGIRLLVSGTELVQLQKMINEADIEFQSLQLLGLFEKTQ